MIYFAVSFIAGIVICNYFAFFPVSIILVSVLFVAGLSRIRANPVKRRCLIIIAIAAGIASTYVRDAGPPAVSFSGTESLVSGTVIDVPELKEGRLRFTLGRVLIDGTGVNGKVRLYLSREYAPPGDNKMLLSPGERLIVLAVLREPASFQNPGVYSYDYKRDGIVAAGRVREFTRAGSDSTFMLSVTGQRQLIANMMDESLSSESASFLKALIPGLKGGIHDDTRRAFSSTGLAHLLSISGTHFGLLAFIIFVIFRNVLKYIHAGMLLRMSLYITPTQIAVLMTVPVLLFYAFISGMSIPTMRSLTIVLIYMLAVFIGRKDQWLNSLAIAAVIILLWNPDSLGGISFVLSFLAVLSIGSVLEMRLDNDAGQINPAAGTSSDCVSRVSALTLFIYGKIKTGLIITFSALMGTAPVAALFFNQFPLIAPVTNLIITPLVCFLLLPLGFVSAFAAVLFNLQSLPFSNSINALSHLVLWLVNIFQEIPYATIHIPDPAFALIAPYYVSFLFAVKSRFKWRIVPLAAVICIYLLVPHVSGNKLNITFLDIGQGDASVVQLPDSKLMIIDGGSKEIKTGERVITPHLRSRGINHIDIIAVSHPHPDHYGGLEYLINNFEIGEVWSSGRETPGSEGFFSAIHKRGIPIRILRRGDVMESGEYRITVLHPYDEFSAGSSRGKFSDENSDSLVLKIEAERGAVLFTGDIEEEAEYNLVHTGEWLKSDIIKVPHHGSRTSSSPAFVQAVHPRYAVISAGRQNPFRHPAPDTLREYENAGARVFRTDMDGAVTASFHEDNIEIRTRKDRQLKRVLHWKDEWRNLRLALRLYNGSD